LTHIPYRPTGSETHFKVIIVSSQFESKTPIAKHRLVNNALKEELDGPVHALSIVAMTPEKYEESIERGEIFGSSPSCRGGDGSLPKKNAV
jgi:stress-induced morphogen